MEIESHERASAKVLLYQKKNGVGRGVLGRGRKEKTSARSKTLSSKPGTKDKRARTKSRVTQNLGEIGIEREVEGTSYFPTGLPGRSKENATKAFAGSTKEGEELW